MDIVDESVLGQKGSRRRGYLRRAAACGFGTLPGSARRDGVRSGWLGLPALMAVVSLMLRAATAPQVNNPRTRLLATYLIPPTTFPIPALR